MSTTARVELRGGAHAEMKATPRGVEIVVFDANGRQCMTVEASVPRSDEEKRQDVLKLLMDEEWSNKTDNSIATECDVSNHFVKKVRQSLKSGHHSAKRRRDE